MVSTGLEMFSVIYTQLFTKSDKRPALTDTYFETQSHK